MRQSWQDDSEERHLGQGSAVVILHLEAECAFYGFYTPTKDLIMSRYRILSRRINQSIISRR
jgi:hypothetical protein